jgi:hypothetical protein
MAGKRLREVAVDRWPQTANEPNRRLLKLRSILAYCWLPVTADSCGEEDGWVDASRERDAPTVGRSAVAPRWVHARGHRRNHKPPIFGAFLRMNIS